MDALDKPPSRRLQEYLVKMGKESNQGAVGFVVEDLRTYMEIRFSEHEPFRLFVSDSMNDRIRAFANAMGADVIAELPGCGPRRAQEPHNMLASIEGEWKRLKQQAKQFPVVRLLDPRGRTYDSPHWVNFRVAFGQANMWARPNSRQDC